MNSDKSEMEERWRSECEGWRERIGKAEVREKERAAELGQAREELSHITQEKNGTTVVLHMQYCRLL